MRHAAARAADIAGLRERADRRRGKDRQLQALVLRDDRAARTATRDAASLRRSPRAARPHGGIVDARRSATRSERRPRLGRTRAPTGRSATTPLSRGRGARRASAPRTRATSAARRRAVPRGEIDRRRAGASTTARSSTRSIAELLDRSAHERVRSVEIGAPDVATVDDAEREDCRDLDHLRGPGRAGRVRARDRRGAPRSPHRLRAAGCRDRSPKYVASTMPGRTAPSREPRQRALIGRTRLSSRSVTRHGSSS